jgi:hypothetical protein
MSTIIQKREYNDGNLMYQDNVNMKNEYHGICKVWYCDGTLIQVSNYKNNKLHGTMTSYIHPNNRNTKIIENNPKFISKIEEYVDGYVMTSKYYIEIDYHKDKPLKDKIYQFHKNTYNYIECTHMEWTGINKVVTSTTCESNVKI